VAVKQGRRFELPADRNSPRAARQAAVEAARACGVDEHAVALCVTEAVTNAVMHAYRGAASPGDVVLELLTPDGGGLEIRVSDHGHGLAPRADSPGAGLGMPLIAAMADRIEIDTSANGTRVSMRFARRAP
jgi:serine/threonine-protein kinase RsbW/stage II sporulation protein AB (anti-sigma F factor)